MFRFVCRRVRSSSGSSSSTWRLKKILASLIVIGALGSLTVTGTFALLTSQETNVHSSIASGTLVFDDTVTGGSPCFSYGGPSSPGNVNNTCQALFTSAALNYPGTASTVTLTIKNDGTLPGTLSLYMPTCAAGATPGDAAPGGGNPCGAGGPMFTVQETNGATTTCWYPSAPTTCTFTAADTLQTFVGNYNTTTNALPLTGGLAIGQTRTFKIGIELPSTASNALQGEEAVFGLTWHLST
jgi:hypothetical protein